MRSMLQRFGDHCLQRDEVGVSKHFGVFIKQIYKYTLYIFYIRKWKLYVTNTFERREGSLQNQRSEHTRATPPVPRLRLRRDKPGEQARKLGQRSGSSRAAALATTPTTVLPYRLHLSFTYTRSPSDCFSKIPPLRTLSTCLTLL